MQTLISAIMRIWRLVLNFVNCEAYSQIWLMELAMLAEYARIEL